MVAAAMIRLLRPRNVTLPSIPLSCCSNKLGPRPPTLSSSCTGADRLIASGRAPVASPSSLDSNHICYSDLYSRPDWLLLRAGNESQRYRWMRSIQVPSDRPSKSHRETAAGRHFAVTAPFLRAGVLMSPRDAAVAAGVCYEEEGAFRIIDVKRQVNRNKEPAATVPLCLPSNSRCEPIRLDIFFFFWWWGVLLPYAAHASGDRLVVAAFRD